MPILQIKDTEAQNVTCGRHERHCLSKDFLPSCVHLSVPSESALAIWPKVMVFPEQPALGDRKTRYKAQQSWPIMGQFWWVVVTIELPEWLAEALISLCHISTSVLARLTNQPIFFPGLSWFLYQKFWVPRNPHPRQTRTAGCSSPILLPSPSLFVDP